MASPSTRSSRRPVGLTTRSERTIHQNNAHNRQSLSNASLRKRPRDRSDRGQDSISPKRARITIEIESRPKAQVKKRSLVIASDANSGVLQRTAQIHATTQSVGKARAPTKHAEKVAIGIKHDVIKLRPSEADTRDEKRTLRSQEGTKYKSELSAYFPDYDVVIGNEPEENHFLNVDTPIIVVDSNPISEKHQLNISKARHTNGWPPQTRSRHFPDALFSDLYQAQQVNFAFLDKHCKVNPLEDPLEDAYYDAAHKKAERLERSIRNAEKGRAQHEKDQVIRLLEGLQGHDWLKVMGVTGITESKKNDYTPARDYFIRGCIGIIEKFRTWREEEKRRKLEKEKALVEAEEYEDEAEASDGDPPDYSDVDHAAARQLHQEAVARSAPLNRPKGIEKRLKVEPKVESTNELEKEFKSFYPKRHQREAAIGKHRRSGRLAIAWGHPVPEVLQTEFELPNGFRNKETLEANARRKRRVKRVSKDRLQS